MPEESGRALCVGNRSFDPPVVFLTVCPMSPTVGTGQCFCVATLPSPVTAPLLVSGVKMDLLPVKCNTPIPSALQTLVQVTVESGV